MALAPVGIGRTRASDQSYRAAQCGGLHRAASDSSYTRPSRADGAAGAVSVDSAMELVMIKSGTTRRISRMGERDTDLDAVPLTCPSCDSRLEVSETHSGGRTIAVVAFGDLMTLCHDGIERFEAPGSRSIPCPACNFEIDPYPSYRSTRGFRAHRAGPIA